ncbi:MAG TPA: zf-HC2 domain-containing protein [Pyrinomonadaceae bacterium]|jgi:anti-sigma factor ChrR (cupin superfamily)
MKETCLDEGVLQSYLDGELSSAMMESVASHLSLCEPCARLASEAQSEMAFFSDALEPELALPVPTALLRARLNAAIDELQTEPPSLQLKPETGLRSWLGSLAASLSLTPQRAAGFASIIALIALAAIFWTIYHRGPKPAPVNETEVASASPNPQAAPEKPGNHGSTVKGPESVAAIDKPGAVIIQPINGERRMIPVRGNRRKETRLASRNATSLEETQPQLLAELPGEKNYLKTIDSLKSVVESSGVTTLSPTLRAEYERNLAVVDQAIAATQRLARRQPNDTNTTQFLYSAYQSKIDLLSAVADQQSQFVARR